MKCPLLSNNWELYFIFKITHRLKKSQTKKDWSLFKLVTHNTCMERRKN